MDDSQRKASPSSPNPSEPADSITSWKEVGYSRFRPAPTLRESLPAIAVVLFLAGACVALLMAVLGPPQKSDGPRYPLPSYVYLSGHCHHRSRAGMVSDALCEEALSKPASDGTRQPRFVYEPAERVCYDTILDVRHKVPTEFCNRKPAADPDK